MSFLAHVGLLIAVDTVVVAVIFSLVALLGRKQS